MKKFVTGCFAIALLGHCITSVRADEVTEWNQIMLNTVRAGGVTGAGTGRPSATVQAAVFDAINGIERRYSWIQVQPAAPSGASRRAAVVEAAYTSLVHLFPAQIGELSAKRTASLAKIASSDEEDVNSESIARGIHWGKVVADAIFAWRNADGFTPAPPPNTGGMAAGQWRPTPPAFASFALVQLGSTTPWVIPPPAYFQLAGPPALTSARYTTDFNEVKSIGRSSTGARTGEETLIANFWNSAFGPIHSWNRVAVRLGTERHTTLAENARILALLNVALADAGIAVWRAKKEYMFWRPITAIQLASSDGNPSTLQEDNWTPLHATPPYPDYPSGLCGFGGACLAVLADYFGENSAFFVDSDAPAMAGVVRSFKSFGAAAGEMVDARVFSGIHFRFADEDAIKLGTDVARYILANACLPLHGEKNGQLRK